MVIEQPNDSSPGTLDARRPQAREPRSRGRAHRVFRRVLLIAALSLLALAAPSLPFAAPPEESGAESPAPPADQTIEVYAAPQAAASPTTAPSRAPAPSRATPARETREIQPPRDLTDLSAWLRYLRVSGRSSLPFESRLFYRRGLVAWQSGARDEATRLVRGASDLDPTFADPHFTLMSWSLFRDPGQALLECAALLELARQSFLFQLSLVANTLVLLLQSLLLGLLATGMIIVALRNHELRHAWHERLSRFLSPRAAKRWSWVFLIVPYLVGVGLALPTVLFLALLWPSLKLRERALAVMLAGSLVTIPWFGVQLGRLALSLDENRAPFYGVLTLPAEPYSADREARLAVRAARYSDDPFLQFGLAWMKRQGNDLAGAEAAYRRVLELKPEHDRAMNNLANLLAAQGRQDEAMKLYQRAINANRANATPYFNLAQIHTQRFEFQKASDALAHAAALNFDLLRTHQSQTGADGHMPLVDQWIAPRDLWQALLSEPHPKLTTALLPPAWRNRIECSGRSFVFAVLVCFVLGLVLGIALHRSMPLRRCSNCERIVCRRCAERRRELALCRSCAAVEVRAKAPDFKNVLLQDHRRKVQRPGRIARTILASAIPGLGLLSFRRVFVPLALLTITAGLVCAWADVGAPFVFQSRLQLPARESSLLTVFLPWLGIYAVSILGYLIELSRYDARASEDSRVARNRGTTIRRVTAAAA